MPLCNPTQDEKGRLDLRFREDVEQALGVVLDPARQVLPATTLNCGSESFDLKIILVIAFAVPRRACPCGRSSTGRVIGRLFDSALSETRRSALGVALTAVRPENSWPRSRWLA
jgi:hypothetical protein